MRPVRLSFSNAVYSRDCRQALSHVLMQAVSGVIEDSEVVSVSEERRVGTMNNLCSEIERNMSCICHPG